MNGGLDLDHLRQWIGREDSAEEVIAPDLVSRFNTTLGLPDVAFVRGDVSPALLHFCLCQPAVPMAKLGRDGHAIRGGFLPPVPLARRMWAGSSIDFHGDLFVGDVVLKRSRVADVSAKLGRSGELCFVTVDHDISVGGKSIISDRQTLVYREVPKTVAPAALEAASAGVVMELVDASATLLFRYSALTFNGHRIHYDFPYATQAEHYAGLVVHGPLQATLLIHLAARRNAGRRPDHFTFRSVHPAIAGETLALHAGELKEGVLELWTSQPGRALAMQATARWNER